MENCRYFLVSKSSDFQAIYFVSIQVKGCQWWLQLIRHDQLWERGFASWKMFLPSVHPFTVCFSFSIGGIWISVNAMWQCGCCGIYSFSLSRRSISNYLRAVLIGHLGWPLIKQQDMTGNVFLGNLAHLLGSFWGMRPKGQVTLTTWEVQKSLRNALSRVTYCGY